MPDLVEASSDADILVFVIPHQFVGKVCDTIKGKIKNDALGISLIKVVFFLLLDMDFTPFISKILPSLFSGVWSRHQHVVLLFPQGVDEGPDGLKLISDVIQEKLDITMSVLMGANIANEVADEKFCETTIG